MSFNLYLFAFKNHELELRAREDMVLALTANQSISANEYGDYVFKHADGGHAQCHLGETQS